LVNPSAAQPPTLLIVDDEWMNRELLQTLLEGAGYQVIQAHAVPPALELARSLKPALAIIDVRLPHHEEGYALCQALKSADDTAHIRVIMITALEAAAEAHKAQAAGADAFVTRGMGVGVILAAVEQLLAR
jgi:CheY-like chemotaxis protein